MEDIVLLQPPFARPIILGDGFSDYRLSDVLRESGEDVSFVYVAKTGVMVVCSSSEYSHKKHFIEPVVEYTCVEEMRGSDAIVRYTVGRKEPVWIKLCVERAVIDLSASRANK